MIALVIARNTFLEAIRDRVLAGVVAGGVALLAVTQIVSPLALGEGARLTTDLGLSGISLLGMLVILMVGTSLVAKELDRRTIYNLLSRPIPRWTYLVGKWAGLCLTLWIVAGVLGALLWGLLALKGLGAHAAPVAQAVYMAGLELTVMTSIAVLFSSFTTPMLSALFTLALFAVGQWSYDLREFAARFPEMLGAIVQGVASVVPNLPLFNMRTLAADGTSASVHHLAVATAYAALYSACVLAIATAIFEKRDFK